MRGSKPGERRGGRQSGTRNKRTVALEAALAEAADQITGALGAEAFDGDAHALLMAVYRDARQPIELRVAAAKAAIGFEKPRLAAIEGKIEGVLTLEMIIKEADVQREQSGATSRTDHQ
jgi:hypothetical protein